MLRRRIFATVIAVPLLALLSRSFAGEEPSAKAIEEAVGQLMNQHVDDQGRIDYAALKAAPDALNKAYRLISNTSPDSHPERFPRYEDRFAYWVNAYNVTAIKGVIDHYPIRSVREVKPASLYSLFDGGGFFAAQKFKYGGKKMSLYRLERKLIFKRFPDPRLHFALNCASGGCPLLPRAPFRAEGLDQRLEAETQAFIRNPKKVRLDHETKTLHLSSLFDWYRDHFESWRPGPNAQPAGSITAFVARYLPAADAAKLLESDYRIVFEQYDWSLNDVARTNDALDR